jgi:outer membrane receptor protein involved in Fe transport
MRKQPLALSILLLALALPGIAQVDLGEISGHLLDPSGAPAPNAELTVRNQGTGLERHSKSAAGGNFSFPSLPPGDYLLTARAPGFAPAVASIHVSGGQISSQDMRLAVGNASASVTVKESERVEVQSETFEVKENYSPRELTDLPSNGRNPLTVALVGAAAQPATDPSVPTSSGQFFQTNASQVVLNGGRDVDTGYLQDGVENVTLLTQSANLVPSVESIQQLSVIVSGADARYEQPGIVNIITKSGANQLHGAAYDFLQNDDLNAAPYNLSGAAQAKTPLRYNQFGANLGGPILHDKLFFFGDYSGLRSRNTSYSLFRVPTAAELTGDFSAQSKILYDPLSYNAATGSDNSFLAETGANAIPPSRFDAVSKKLLAYYPAANLPLNTALNVNYETALANQVNADEYLERTDYILSAKDTLSGDYGYSKNANNVPEFGPSIYGRTYSGTGQNAYGQETHIISPNLINSARFGYNRSNQFETEAGVGQMNYTQSFGLNNLMPTPAQYAPPTIAISSFDTLGYPYSPQGAIQNRFQLLDQLDWVHGRHSLFIGAEFVRTLFDGDWTIGNNGDYTFDGTFTSQYTKGARSTSQTGVPFADFLLGYPSKGIGATGISVGNFRQVGVAGYIQDNWKILSRLTLNLGLRYEFSTPPNDANGHSSIYDLPTNRTIPGTWDTNYKDFAPRFGFAYRPFTNTVLRGGYGIYYAGTPWNDLQFLLAHAPNFIPQSPAFSITDPTLTENIFVANPSATGQTPQTLAKHMPDTYVEQYNFFIEQTFARNYSFEVGYSGESGHDESVRVNANQPDAIAPGTTTTKYNLRPYTYIGDVFGQYNIGWSNSNGLQTKLQRRFSNGAQFIARYVFSKALNISDGDRNVIENYYDPKLYYALSAYDRTHQFTFSAIYRLPFHFKPLPVQSALAGWQVAGIYSIASGLPASITATDNADTSSLGTFEAQEICNPTQGFVQTRTEWFNKACFVQPGAFQYGVGGRNAVRQPILNNLDISLSKTFTVHERHNLQLRFEAFNAPNHPQFALTGQTAVSSSALGALTGTARPMRSLQVGVRYFF